MNEYIHIVEPATPEVHTNAPGEKEEPCHLMTKKIVSGFSSLVYVQMENILFSVARGYILLFVGDELSYPDPE